jgi:putative sigma-54 modulation protein
VEKLRHKAEATLMMRGNKIYADATDSNMYAAIDALSDKLDRRVKKHKEKASDHHAEEVIKARTAS